MLVKGGHLHHDRVVGRRAWGAGTHGASGAHHHWPTVWTNRRSDCLLEVTHSSLHLSHLEVFDVRMIVYVDTDFS